MIMVAAYLVPLPVYAEPQLNDQMITDCFVEKLSGKLFEDALKGFHE